MTDDTIIDLPSGSEISIEAAKGDLERAGAFLADDPSDNAQGFAADLEHVSELIDVLAKPEHLAVYFTPDAIADAFDRDLIDEDDEREVARAEWVEQASDDELRKIGEACIGGDIIWRTFHELIEMEVDDALEKRS